MQPVPKIPIPIPTSVNASPFCKVSVKLSQGWRRLPLFMGDFCCIKSAGIDCKLKMVIHVFTEWALQGVQAEARGGVAPWVLSPPRRQAKNQTHSVT